MIWAEKYRPRTVEECVLPPKIKDAFKKFVADKNMPNLLLSGPAGIGKTSVAKAVLNECGFDHILINGSLKGNIDTLRNEIMAYASTTSFTGGRKYVILDEADYLNANSTQPALRNFMEEFSKNCGFILTCNFKNRLIDPLQSRCSTVDFTMTKDEKAACLVQFLKRVEWILESEKVPYDKPSVAKLITRHFPDFRKVLNDLQRYAANGKIDSGVLASMSDESFKRLVGFLKEKNFTEMRKWVAQNSDLEPHVIFRSLYDASHDLMVPASVPQMVIHLAEYDYKSAFVVDQEVNVVAALTEIMADCKWK